LLPAHAPSPDAPSRGKRSRAKKKPPTYAPDPAGVSSFTARVKKIVTRPPVPVHVGGLAERVGDHRVDEGVEERRELA
jgi:hypothetical protein